MLAWRVEETIRCRQCGTRPDEWKDDKNAYRAEAFRCDGCERIEAEQDSWAQEEGKAFGIKFRLRKPD